jgi:hypothetical protein
MSQTCSLRGHTVRIFPQTDPEFRSAVLDAVAALSATGGVDGEGLAAVQLEAVLRREFYRVHVEEQTAFGAIDGSDPVIYVFRDGSLIPMGDGPGTPLYVGPMVGPHRNVVRNVVARRNSATLVYAAVDAVTRSRRRRGGVGPLSGGESSHDVIESPAVDAVEQPKRDASVFA